jgi:UDP-N-acetylglucosamine 2-epimerase (non-hydrolysing)/GDP/UDP-N,N'-diacetylbacillosamine 2-epimerase (hydrolysing)
MKRILAVTSSRADYGLMRSVYQKLDADRGFEFQLITTGMHLASTSGGSLEAILADGFKPAARIEMQLASDTPSAAARSLGLALMSFGEQFDRLTPDYILIPGDRYEMLAPVEAALLARIPVMHVFGGDETTGAFDNSIRHAISKMSHVHFVTTETARRRVVQMGENPRHVHNVGSPSLDRIAEVLPVKRDDVFREIGIPPRARTVVVTFHPVTLALDSDRQVAELIAALAKLGPDYAIVITAANQDPGGIAVNDQLKAFAARAENVIFRESLNHRLYLQTLSVADVVVGNSSSGLYEAPALKVATVDIGDRQTGREKAASVVGCPPQADAILAAIHKAIALDCSAVTSPYGDGRSADRILDILRRLPEPRELIVKQFHDLPAAHD